MTTEKTIQLSLEEKQQLAKVAQTIRGLSMDGVEAAGCGHPGLPLGCAELGAYLFAKVLNYNTENPNWMNRDRFILSAGHGSMLLYTLLHLAQYDLSVDDIKQFRQLHSPTAGHPEYGECVGVETTTGPLGQGLATATGIALGNKLMAASFGVEDEKLLDNTTYVLASDGDIMEGVTAEAGSFAGHYKLDNLIVLYDANDICLDGELSDCFSEDTQKRYEAYGWYVQTINGHDFDEIATAIFNAEHHHHQPSLIIAKTIIGFGSPNMSGKSDIHGKAMGAEEVALTKDYLGIPLDPHFYIPSSVKDLFSQRKAEGVRLESEWQEKFDAWASEFPEKAERWQLFCNKTMTEEMMTAIRNTESKTNVATRQLSHAILQTIHDHVPYVVGGSADLSCSDNTMMTASPCIKPGQFEGRNIKYGVREFAMGTIASGLAIQGQILPYCGTFLMFSDYMRNAIRLASLMKLPVVYQFTHDSILLGEDGPTHQPVEHLASLRAMPNLIVIRPADLNEVKGAWLVALQAKQPVALILSRQKVTDFESTSIDDTAKGAYIVKKESKEAIDFCILATGSELELAMQVAEAKESEGSSVRVLSFPSFELFEAQDEAYQAQILGEAKQYVSIEAQTSFGWHKWIGRDGIAISVDTFGKSAPAADLALDYGLTLEKILEKLA